MTILKITIEDEQADLLRALLKDVPYVKKVEEEHHEKNDAVTQNSSLKNIQKILENAKGKNLFADIEDPVEWQREIRKEWDRDL